MARRLGSPVARWAGVGPYFAMFPVEFSDAAIELLTDPFDRVLDPFAGRATVLYSAVSRGRYGAGVELNPVGWVYGQAKLNPASQMQVENKVAAVARQSRKKSARALHELPQFFAMCYSQSVLKFLITARDNLDWQGNRADRTVMAFILVHLHGKSSGNLSNQMRQTKAMAPDYSIRWWRANRSSPPDIDPEMFLVQRIRWRYAKGVPSLAPSDFLLGDSSVVLSKLKSQAPFDLLLTSPPYCGVTNYYYDQWLRLWMLGGQPGPSPQFDPHKRKFESQAHYRQLLFSVFSAAAQMMKSSGVVYVRTDARAFTFRTTLEVLRNVFPHWWDLYVLLRPFTRPTQTALFGDRNTKPGDVDIVMSGRPLNLYR